MSLQTTHENQPWTPGSSFGSNLAPLNGPVDLHPALETVRRMKEFQPPQPSLLDEWLNQPYFKKLAQQVNHNFDQMLGALQHLFSNFHLPGGSHLSEALRNTLSNVVGFLVVLLGLAALYFLLGLFLRWATPQTESIRKENRVVNGSPLVNSHYHARQAQDAASQYNYAESIRQWYLASLCLLDETGTVAFTPARTNREYTLQLASDALVRKPFELLSGQFEVIHYGQALAQESQSLQCGQWYDRLRGKLIPHA